MFIIGLDDQGIYLWTTYIIILQGFTKYVCRMWTKVWDKKLAINFETNLETSMSRLFIAMWPVRTQFLTSGKNQLNFSRQIVSICGWITQAQWAKTGINIQFIGAWWMFVFIFKWSSPKEDYGARKKIQTTLILGICT